jgi:outer membrane protein assembly factor BamB
MGPKRDNVWREDGLLDRFPAGGPKLVWRTATAGGYAGPAVADGKAYVTDFVNTERPRGENSGQKKFTGTERVRCLDAATGSEVWKQEYPVVYGIDYPAGPRCTPLVHQNKVYTLGAEGHLFCFEATSGKIIWSVDLKSAYKTKSATWGYAAHPLIDGQKLITLAGGEGSHVVALDKNTGKEIWRSSTSPEQGYCPPVIIEAAGVRQLLLLRPNALAAVDPETGQEYWAVPYEASYGSIIMTPVRWGDHLFAGGFNNKNLLVKLDRDKPAAEVVWRDQRGKGLSPVNVQPFVEDGVMYGYDQNGILYAVELPSGNRLWESRAVFRDKRPVSCETAFIVKQADRFWLFNDQGELIIARLSPKGYEEIDRAKVIEPTNVASGRDVVWCMPAFANRRLYVRNDKEIICIDLAK